jgi:hypothetical protein
MCGLAIKMISILLTQLFESFFFFFFFCIISIIGSISTKHRVWPDQLPSSKYIPSIIELNILPYFCVCYLL